MINVTRKTVVVFVLVVSLFYITACRNPFVESILQRPDVPETDIFSVSITLADAEAGDKVIAAFNDRTYVIDNTVDTPFIINNVPAGVIVTLTAEPGDERRAAFSGDGTTSAEDIHIFSIEITVDAAVTVRFSVGVRLNAPVDVILINTGQISFTPGENNSEAVIYRFSLFRGENDNGQGIPVTGFQSIELESGDTIKGLSVEMLQAAGEYWVTVRAHDNSGEFIPSVPSEPSNSVYVVYVSVTVVDVEDGDSVIVDGVSYTADFSVNVFRDTALTLMAEPGEGRRATFSGDGTPSLDDANVRIIDNVADGASVTVEFADEGRLTAGDFTVTGLDNVVFNNTPQGVTVAFRGGLEASAVGDITSWKYVCTDTSASWTHPDAPTNAGIYDIKVTTTRGDEFEAVKDLPIGALTIHPASLTVATAAHTRVWDGTTTAIGVGVTLNGKIPGAEDVEPGVVTAEYTNSNAGATEINITAVTLTGGDARNYTVTVPVTKTVQGITHAPIEAVGVTVTAPATAVAPVTTATIVGANFTAGSVIWDPNHNPFRGDTPYTATVTLTAGSNHIFAESSLPTATVNGTTVIPSFINSETVILSRTFDATAPAVLDRIAIQVQPRLNYIHGESLDLTALVVKLTYNDETSRDVLFANLEGNGITTSLAHEHSLVRATYGNPGVPITVTHAVGTANTGPLVIARANVTVPAPVMYGRTHNSITLSAVTATPPQTQTGQTIQYARSDINIVPESGWQEDLTFGGLTAGTAYYFFARVLENVNYNAAVSTGTSIETLSQNNIDINFNYLFNQIADGAKLPWQGEDGNLIDNIVINLSAQNAVTLTLTGLGNGYEVVWRIDSAEHPIKRFGESLTLSYSDFTRNDTDNAGQHLLYVEVRRLSDDTLRSHTTLITVTN